MTAARQERKSCRLAVGFLAILGAAASFCGGGRSGRSHAAAPGRWSSTATPDWPSMASIRSPISSMPGRGSAAPDLELRSAGASWRFANEGNRAAFAADPDVYTPRFGGHDPIAAARGAATPGHPKLWLIAENQLFLF